MTDDEQTMKPPRKNATSTRGRPFAKNNPGRRRGSKNRTTVAMEALLAGEAEALTRKAIEAALGGDVTALRLCLDRLMPAVKERAVNFAVPELKSADDVPAALAAVLEAVASGELTPGEAATLAGIIDRFRGAYELAEIERRLAALEERKP